MNCYILTLRRCQQFRFDVILIFCHSESRFPVSVFVCWVLQFLLSIKVGNLRRHHLFKHPFVSPTSHWFDAYAKLLWAAIGSQPLQHLQVASTSCLTACVRIPVTAVRSCPFQSIQISSSCNHSTQIGPIPRRSSLYWKLSVSPHKPLDTAEHS